MIPFDIDDAFTSCVQMFFNYFCNFILAYDNICLLVKQILFEETE